jgi:hypothetical protein
MGDIEVQLVTLLDANNRTVALKSGVVYHSDQSFGFTRATHANDQFYHNVSPLFIFSVTMYLVIFIIQDILPIFNRKTGYFFVFL